MAIAHLHAKIFTRSKGHSVLSKAAYRSGSKLLDERTGRVWDYERKNHVEEKGVLAPAGAPGWVFDRQRLWNTVERSVRRKDSQLARELEISFPRELSPEQQHELLQTFVHEHFVSKGMVADYAFHRPPGNPHAHIMLTMYELHEGGFGKKVKAWDARSNVAEWRGAWELAANRALANAGRSERIDMRSYAAQGIGLEPQPKLGRSPKSAHLDGRDMTVEALVAYQLAARRNGERIAARPELLLELLSSKRSSFTERDILRALNRYTADAEQFTQVRAIVHACPELVELSPSANGSRRFSTREVVTREHALLASAHTLAQRGAHVVGSDRINRAISSSTRTLTDEQAAAVRHIAASGDLAMVEGYAGTGKSTMLAAARAAWEAQGLVVVGGALAGKAAEGLADPTSAGIASRTLASWQYNWDRGREHLTSKHVLVIDEAGMVGTRELEKVLAHARDAGAKVVLVGDTRQLQSIEPGAPMRQLLERYDAARLSGVIRQKQHSWQARATLDFAQGRAAEALRAYGGSAERLKRFETPESAREALVAAWDKDRHANPAESSILLAYRRNDVRELNILARGLRREAGELGPEHRLPTRDGDRLFAAGDRVYFLKNDRELGVTNGTLGTVERIQGTVLTVRLDSHQQVSVDLATYDALDHGYAATVHKSQGVTVDRSYVLASKYMDAAASYVALSRHRIDASVFYDAEEFRSEAELIRRLAREQANENALDASALLPSGERLDKRLQDEREFLNLSESAQEARIAALRLTAEHKPISAAEVFDRLPEVREATERRDGAADALSVATRQLADFEDAHPVATELRTAAYRHHLANVERGERELLSADRYLRAVRTDPERRAFAETTAAQHNRALRQAQDRLLWCDNLRQRQLRDDALSRYAAAANAKAGSTRFRIATRADEGRSFEVVLKRSVRNEPVLVLRAEGRGPLVLADARLFAGEPAVGSRAVLGPQSTQLQTRGNSHDDRSRE